VRARRRGPENTSSRGRTSSNAGSPSGVSERVERVDKLVPVVVVVPGGTTPNPSAARDVEPDAQFDPVADERARGVEVDLFRAGPQPRRWARGARRTRRCRAVRGPPGCADWLAPVARLSQPGARRRQATVAPALRAAVLELVARDGVPGRHPRPSVVDSTKPVSREVPVQSNVVAVVISAHPVVADEDDAVGVAVVEHLALTDPSTAPYIRRTALVVAWRARGTRCRSAGTQEWSETKSGSYRSTR